MNREEAKKINVLALDLFISRSCVHVFLPKIGARRNICGWQEQAVTTASDSLI